MRAVLRDIGLSGPLLISLTKTITPVQLLDRVGQDPLDSFIAVFPDDPFSASLLQMRSIKVRPDGQLNFFFTGQRDISFRLRASSAE